MLNILSWPVKGNNFKQLLHGTIFSIVRKINVNLLKDELFYI